MEFFKELELIIEAESVDEKIERFENFYVLFQADSIEFEKNFRPKKFERPCYM